MQRYKANSRADVSRLAVNLATTPPHQRAEVIAQTYLLGLMVPRGFIFSWAIRSLKRRKGLVGVTVFLNHLDHKQPGLLRSFLEDTIRHVLRGRDTEDVDSVGGWSQREIDLFTSKVTFNADAVVGIMEVPDGR